MMNDGRYTNCFYVLRKNIKNEFFDKFLGRNRTFVKAFPGNLRCLYN